MKMLAVSALTLTALLIGPANAAPIQQVAAKTSNGPYVGCSLSGAAVNGCRNVLNFKTYYECRSNRMERRWTDVESSYYCRALDPK